MQFQFGADDDDRASGIVDAFSKQVLTEAALLTFQCSAERLQWAIVNTAQHTSTSTVVKQRINGLLKHALFVAHNYFGSAQLHQLLQTVVAIDDASIKVV